MPDVRQGDLLSFGPVKNTDGNTSSGNLSVPYLRRVSPGNGVLVAFDGNCVYRSDGMYMIGGNDTAGAGALTLVMVDRELFNLPCVVDYQIMTAKRYDEKYGNGGVEGNVGFIANNAITAASFATDAANEIGNAAWASPTRTLTVVPPTANEIRAEINSANSTLLTAMAGNITAHFANFTFLNGLYGNTTAISAAVNGLLGNLTLINTNVTSQLGNLTTINTNVTSQLGNLTAIAAAVNGQLANLTLIDTDVLSLRGNLTLIANRVAEGAIRSALGLQSNTLSDDLYRITSIQVLMARKDSAVATDLATFMTYVNGNFGTGTGSFDNTTDSEQAIRDRGDAAWITATSVTVSDKGNFSLTTAEHANIANATFDQANGIESGLTLRQAQRLQSASAAGNLSGAQSGTETLKSATANTTRIVFTTDAGGNRTSTLTLG